MTITETTCEQRVNAYAWPDLESDLDAHGCAILRGLLDDEECRTIASTYANPAMFRSRIVMARHGFGRGEYQYFAYPLPALIAGLRQALYPRLVPVANRWHEAMGIAGAIPGVA